MSPSIETTLSLLGAKVKGIRVIALSHFSNLFAESIQSIEGKKVCVLGGLSIYKFAAAKDIAEEKGAILVRKFSDDCDLLVVGQTPKIETFPDGIKVTSATHFEAFLDQSEERPLTEVDSKDFEEKLMGLLLSEDPQNGLLALKLMEDGGIPNALIPLVFGVFKMHPDSKVRSRTKKVLERHGGSAGEQAMNICGKRNYLSMKEDEKPREDYDQLAQIEGFDETLFAYYVAREHSMEVGRFLMSSSESKWAKRFVMETWNVDSCEISTAPSKHFADAKNIKRLRCTQLSDTIWEMENLETLEIIAPKEKLVIPSSISNLASLNTLKVIAKEVVLEGTFPGEVLSLRARKISYEENFSANNLKRCFIFGETKDYVSFFVSGLEELRIETKKFELTKTLCDRAPQLKTLMLDVKSLIHEEGLVVPMLESLVINDSKKVNLKPFLVASLKSIKITEAGKTTLDESLAGMNLDYFSIESESILFDCKDANFSANEMSVCSLDIAFKSKANIEVADLEMFYRYNPDLMQGSVRSLKISFGKEFQEKGRQDHEMPEDLQNYPDLKSLEFYGGYNHNGWYVLKFDTKVDFCFETLKFDNVNIVVSQTPSFQKLENVVFDSCGDAKEREDPFVPFLPDSIRTMYVGRYEHVHFRRQVTNVEELRTYDAKTEEIDAKCFPKLRKLVYRVCHDNRDQHSFDLSVFKELREIEFHASDYYTLRFDDLSKNKNLEKLSFYVGKDKDHQDEKRRDPKIDFPMFNKPLSLKVFELREVEMSVGDSNHKYFKELEELVLNDAFVSDLSIFRLPSLKKIRIEKPPAKMTGGWREDLTQMFPKVDIVYS